MKLPSADLICQALTVLWKHLFNVRCQRRPTRAGQEIRLCMSSSLLTNQNVQNDKMQLEKTVQKKEVRKGTSGRFSPGSHR